MLACLFGWLVISIPDDAKYSLVGVVLCIDSLSLLYRNYIYKFLRASERTYIRRSVYLFACL